MRRFKIWLDKGVAGVETAYDTVEPDEATDEHCAEACKDALDLLFENELDAGWRELQPGEQI